MKQNIQVLTGAEAAAEATRQIDPDVVSAYPITPQTPIIEKIAELKAEGKVTSEIILVESEHSAMSVVVGAAAGGVRAMTATSSQGLALMWEILPIASGLRLPIVMNLVTRALSSPINIHGDHSDAMGVRDLGWIQIFSENPQEVYENNFLAIKLAEDPEVRLPAMICQDGFVTSHCAERILIYPNEIVKEFLGRPFVKESLFNKKPLTFGPLVLPDYYFEFKRQQNEAMKKVKKVYLKVGKKLSQITSHQYPLFESYKLKDAKAAIVTMGSTAGLVKAAVDELRKKGQKVGLLKIRLFRPFPYQEVAKTLEKVKIIGVLDRALNLGSLPSLATDIHLASPKHLIQSYVFGLGGRDVKAQEIKKVFEELLKGKVDKEPRFIGLRE